MKKYLFIALVLILGLMPAGLASAEGGTTTNAPGTWASSINIQNTQTDPSAAAATVVLSFRDSSGNEALSYTVSPTIASGGSRSLYVPSDIAGLSSGQYSVVASSDQPLQIITNLSSTSPSTTGSYLGVQGTDTATTLYFPGLYNNYYGFSSEIVLQNAEDTAASDVYIQFYNQGTGAAVGSPYGPFAIPASASRIFKLGSGDLANVPSGNTNGLLSAKVTSGKKLAGLADMWTSAYSGEFTSYNAASAGTTTAYAPALYNQYYGFMSALTVQNLDPTNNNSIKITFSNGQEYTATLAPLQAKQWIQLNDANMPSGNTNGVFSAKVESTSSLPLVVLVNQENKTTGQLASFVGPNAPTKTVNCPVVMKAYYQWFSAQTVQNVGAAPTNITITYSSGETKTINDVPVNGTTNIIELASTGSVLPNTSSVSAVITADQPLVAVVQENSNERYTATHGDYLTSYSCMNQ